MRSHGGGVRRNGVGGDGSEGSGCGGRCRGGWVERARGTGHGQADGRVVLVDGRVSRQRVGGRNVV